MTMKFFTYILTIYLITLAVVPCCALDDCPEDNAKKECGTCSPFFNCEKCASATINMEAGTMNMIIVAVSPVYSDFICPRISTIHYDFWQPPRLS
jgi:hypothetical protein